MRRAQWIILASLVLLGAAAPAAAQLIPADDAYSVEQGGLLDVPTPGVLANDCCGSGNTAVLDTGPTHGTLTLGPFGQVVYQHDDGASTQDSFTYGLMDRDGVPSETTATVTITITPPEPPGGEEPPGGGEDPPPGGEEEPGDDLGAVVTFTEVGSTVWRTSIADESLLRWDVDTSTTLATVVGSPGLPTSIGSLNLEPLTVGGSAAVRELLLECHRLALLVQARPDTFDLEVEVLFADTALRAADEERLAIDVSAAMVACSLVRD